MEKDTKIILAVVGAGALLYLAYPMLYPATASGSKANKPGANLANLYHNINERVIVGGGGTKQANTIKAISGVHVGAIAGPVGNAIMPTVMSDCKQYIFKKDTVVESDYFVSMPCSQPLYIGSVLQPATDEYPACKKSIKTYKKGDSICGRFSPAFQGPNTGGAPSGTDVLRWMDGGVEYSIYGEDAVNMVLGKLSFTGEEEKWQDFR